MAPSDDDIQFDFFDDEPATAETAQQPRVRLPQRARRGPRRPIGPPPAARPLVRLLALVFLVTFLVLVFALLIQSCAAQSRHSVYANYIDKVDTIAQQSTLDGKNTVTALTSSGLTVAQIVAKLRTIATDEQQNVASAEGLVPPGRLRTENADLVEALQLRVSGVNGLAAAFQSTIGSKASPSVQAVALSEEAYRLLASDVVWADLFEAQAKTQFQHDGVQDVVPPSSSFLASPDLFITQRAMASIVQRIEGKTTTGGGTQTCGLHGTNIASVAALPNGTSGSSEVLTEGSLNTITTSTNLVFQVTISDGGNFQEVQIPITLTINRPQSAGGPITKTEKVQVIDSGENASVVFSDLGDVPFGSQTTLSVAVTAVPCETNVSNNSAQYKVIFSLPS
jgi:hypothetical protein